MGVGALFKLGGQIAKKVDDVPEEALKAAKVAGPEKAEEVRKLPAGAKRIGNVPSKAAPAPKALDTTTTVYHGTSETPETLGEFVTDAGVGQRADTGIWVSSDKTHASTYSSKEGHVAEVDVDTVDFALVDFGGTGWDERADFLVLDFKDGRSIDVAGKDTNEIARIAKENGATGVQFDNVVDLGFRGDELSSARLNEIMEEGTREYVILDTKAIVKDAGSKSIKEAASTTKAKPLPSGAKRTGDVPKAAGLGAAALAASTVAAPSTVTDDVFYLNIGKHAESDHGDTPIDTHDAREKDLSVKSKDVGYGHKVKASEDKSGFIHGVRFKNEDGTYIPLTAENKVTILKGDMAAELSLARNLPDGWDTKLKALGIKWDDLETPYKQALTSLAYNTGGSVAGEEFTAVLKAAKDLDVKEFAKQLRRNDNKKKTAGMDNRVAKELYYSGLIKNFSEVSDVLPLGSADVSGVPK